MDTLNRIKLAIQWLIYEGIADNQENIGKLLGYSNKSSFSQVLNGKKTIPESFIKRLCSLHEKLNEHWILTGKGDMLNENNTDKLTHSENGEGVPYFEDIESTGSIIIGKANGGTEIPTFFIDYEHFNDCTAYIQHVGDSMYPKYCAGEIIAVKRVYNLNIILWGEAYLVVTNSDANELRTVKLLFQHEDKSKIILRSSNPNFKGDTEIDKSDIISLFIVKGKITRNQL